MKTLLAALVILAAPAVTLAQAKKPAPSAIRIEPVQTGDVSIPEEFRYAIYEHLVERIQQSGTFHKVFRSGDREANNVPDLVTLHTSVEAFKEGSQTKRELAPVVVGSTTVDVSVTVTDRNGQTLLDRKVAGKVRIFGENLGVTNDLAKRITKLLGETF